MDSKLQVGDKAPAFSLRDQFNDVVSLDHYGGQWLVVWWIPSTMAEMTPACCDQIARGFGEHAAENPDLNIVGVSFDPPEQMRVFAQRGTVLFPLLSDESKETGKAYGVYRGDEDEWNCFPRKRAFLVAPDGRIAKVYLNIDPDLFVHEVLDDLEELAPRKAGLFGRVLASLKG